MVRAEVASIDAFSGHADRSELSAYVNALGGNIRKITVVHGEEEQSLAFAETLRGLRPGAQVSVPKLGEIVQFGMDESEASA
jgi:metallo-beta-lactamase family protein